MSLDQLASSQLPQPTVRLDAAEVASLLASLPTEWQVEGDLLRRAFALPDYATGVRLVICIGKLADELNHHPDLHLRWGRLAVSVSTHDVDGLSKLDFILAAKIEQAVAAAAARAVE